MNHLFLLLLDLILCPPWSSDPAFSAMSEDDLVVWMMQWLEACRNILLNK
jgi:hypothetical protein